MDQTQTTLEKNQQNNQNYSKNKTSNKNEINTLIKMAYKTKLIWYIKALLQIYKTLPNVIDILDKIIEQKATTLIPTSSITGSYVNTLSQFNKVLDISERKDKLLNIYVITEQMLDALKPKDKEFVVLRFIQKNSIQDISKQLDISDRTVFRKSNDIIEKIAVNLLKENYTTRFLDHQIGNESWIFELIQSKFNEDNFSKRKNKKLITNRHHQ